MKVKAFLTVGENRDRCLKGNNFSGQLIVVCDEMLGIITKILLLKRTVMLW